MKSLAIGIFALCFGAAITSAAPSERDAKLVQRVCERLFAQATPVESWEWPPEVEILPTTEINAVASLVEKTRDGVTVKQPRIEVYQGFLDQIVMGQDEPCAVVLGHELSHILLKHATNAPVGSPLVNNAVSRQDESDADVLGMKLALQAGFDYQGLILGIKRMREHGNFCTFQHLDSTHPAWTDRLAAIDDRKAELWRATSAFENGVTFLIAEQYALAARCFKQVTRDFPSCYEGWANLGYAQLMMYCDALEPDDLREFDLGLLVVGGFYHRPDSLATASRGIDEELWFEAVGSLREALRIKPELLLPKANLAVAYLVRPAGSDTGKSAELFEQVLEALDQGDVEDGLEPLAHAALLVNAGVAEQSLGNRDQAARLFERARKLVDKPEADVLYAIQYNEARMQAVATDESTRRSAVAGLEGFLQGSHSSGAWWPLAYDQYQALCHELKVPVKSPDQFQKERETRYRLVTSVEFPDGKVTEIGQPVEEVVQMLGEGQRIEVVRRTNVHRRKYSERGVELVCTDRVLAVRLRGKNAPSLVLRATGVGGAKREIHVGMALQDVEAVLAASATVYDTRLGTNTETRYRFYPQLGVGILVNDANQVHEIIIARLPYQA